MRNQLIYSPITGYLYAPREERRNTNRTRPAVTARGRQVAAASRRRIAGNR
jgi:hypothetical protein